jgi:hypothetical protein
VVADVVEPVRLGAAARLHRAIVGGGIVEAGDHAGDDVVDIGEIAVHVAVVEHRDRLARRIALVNSHIIMSGRPTGHRR